MWRQNTRRLENKSVNSDSIKQIRVQSWNKWIAGKDLAASGLSTMHKITSWPSSCFTAWFPVKVCCCQQCFSQVVLIYLFRITGSLFLMIKTNRKTDLLTWEKKQWLEIVFLEQEKNEDITTCWSNPQSWDVSSVKWDCILFLKILKGERNFLLIINIDKQTLNESVETPFLPFSFINVKL